MYLYADSSIRAEKKSRPALHDSIIDILLRSLT
jgi:hypothetical protein